MNKRNKKLREYFPSANEETRLVIMGSSARLVIGRSPLQLTEYDVGKGKRMYAAYSEATNTIYIRLIELSLLSKTSKED